MAHKLEEKSGGNDVPSKDQLIDAIIFKAIDIVSITATNVDLDYATKGKRSSAKILF